MHMTKLALAIAMALSSTIVFAQDTGKAAATGAGDSMMAKDFWEKNAKGGFLSKEDVARFKGADGKTVDMQKIDMDNDGKVSEKEWSAYQQTAGAAGKSPPAKDAQPTYK
jgi:hypothetical protein